MSQNDVALYARPEGNLAQYDPNWLAEQAKWPQGAVNGNNESYFAGPAGQAFLASQQQIAPLQEKINNLAAQLAKQQQPAATAPTAPAPDPTAWTPRPPIWDPKQFSGGPSIGLPPLIDIGKTMPGSY